MNLSPYSELLKIVAASTNFNEYLEDSEEDTVAMTDELYPCVYCSMKFSTEDEQLAHLDQCMTVPNTAQVCTNSKLSFTLTSSIPVLFQDVGNKIKPLVKCDNAECDREFTTTKGMKVHFKTCKANKPN